jgi:hypothetical protein
VTLIANFGLLKNPGYNATTAILEVSFMTLSPFDGKFVYCVIGGLLPQGFYISAVQIIGPNDAVSHNIFDMKVFF